MRKEPLLARDRAKVNNQSFDLCMDVAEDFSKLCGTSVETMLSKTRQAVPVAARLLSMHVLNDLGVNKKYITWFFNRERTVIYNALRSAQNMLDTEHDVREHTNQILIKHESRRI